jgi:hypothetical protein
MASIIDQIISISISDAAATPETTAFTIPGILAVGSKPAPYGTATTRRYFSADDVKTDWGDSSNAYFIARDVFGQDVKPEYVVVISVGATESASAISTAITAAIAQDNSFYHILANASSLEIAQAIGDACNSGFKVAHLDSSDTKVLDAVATDDIVTELKAANHGRVSIWYHTDPAGRNDSLCGGITGKRCGKDPAKGSWAHKELSGITADALTGAQYNAAMGKSANVFCTVAGVSRTYMGTMADGTYIDAVIRKDWIHFRIQERLFALLGSANDGDGLSMDDDGIQAVGAVINSVFAEAADDKHRYILPGYSVSVPQYKDVPLADRAKRNLPLVKFTFSILESINTVRTISGAIVA